MDYRAVVMGASAGGFEALRIILTMIKPDFPMPILIVQHISSDSDNYMVSNLNKLCKISVKEAVEREKILPGLVYIAPPNYHLLVEKDETISLTVDPKVNYSRPSIDVLFESAADVYEDDLIGIVLTGANSDGSNGLKKIKAAGGMTIVQDPRTAYADTMPKASIRKTEVDHILMLDEIGILLNDMVRFK